MSTPGTGGTNGAEPVARHDGVVGDLAAVLGNDHPALAVDGRRAVADVQGDPVLGVPRLAGQLQVLGVTLLEVFRQVHPIVGRPRLLAERHDLEVAIGVVGHQPLAEPMAHHAVADHHDGLPRQVLSRSSSWSYVLGGQSMVRCTSRIAGTSPSRRADPHRAGLVRGLPRLGVERRERQPVGRARRASAGRAARPDGRGDERPARADPRRDSTTTHPAGPMPRRAASAGLISTYGSLRVELAEHVRLGRPRLRVPLRGAAAAGQELEAGTRASGGSGIGRGSSKRNRARPSGW